MKRLPSINFWVVAIAVVLVVSAISLNRNNTRVNDSIPYSEFLSKVQQKTIARIEIDGANLKFVSTDKTSNSTHTPSLPDSHTIETWYKQGIVVNVTPPAKNDNTNMIVVALVAAAMVWALMSMSRGNRSQQGDSPFGFSKSKAKLITETPKTNFKDVAGCDEAKEELKEVVEFLKAPARFHELGARTPKGILLVGPPGSGKTHLARAVAGEAKVPFIAASGSDFVEMFVGVGAARVRDLFETARQHNPCIIFIDEIDGVGRKRGSSFGGGNEEREQTLNQLLVALDGFEKDTNIIVIAATNRPDILDPALLRPGRFDRQVTIDAPDVRGREQILRLHAKGKQFLEDVDLQRLAKRTVGFVGADLENLLNEAALLTARDRRKRISNADLDEAADRVVMGPARKSLTLTTRDREITAYHEAGHAIAAHMLPHADNVHKVTIVPRGSALGYMMPSPQETMHWTKKKLLDQIAVALAGRIAEEQVFDDVTTGAESDFRKATELARRMITEWGMHPDFGVMAYQTHDNDYLGSASHRNYSESTAQRIDQAIQAILQEQHTRVAQLLIDNKQKLTDVTLALLEHETLDAEAFAQIMDGPKDPVPTSNPTQDDPNYPKAVVKVPSV